MNNLQYLMNKQDELGTIMGGKAGSSILVHGLYVPADAIQTRLNIFGHNLVNYTHDPIYEVQLIGSATGLNYQGKNCLVCTKHQLKGIDPEDVGVIVPETNNLVTSESFTRLNPQIANETDSFDLCSFGFTAQAVTHPSLNQRFFKLRPDAILGDDQDGSVIAYLAYGFPFDSQKYNIADENHVGLVVHSMTCKPASQPTDRSLGKCTAMDGMGFDPNGLSGGPVFATVLEGTDAVLKFAGVINRAGGGTIHFIRASAVVRLLDLAVQS